jgi:PPOX class probable F420-dependent enzyme
MTYPHTTMTTEEISAFLADTRHAVLATGCVDGPPLVSPVWYLHQGGKLYIGVARSSAKYRNLKREPRVSLCIDGAHPDARYVAIYGTVDFIEEKSQWRAGIETAIAQRYHESPAEAERYLRETADTDLVLLAITPQKILGHDYN